VISFLIQSCLPAKSSLAKIAELVCRCFLKDISFNPAGGAPSSTVEPEREVGVLALAKPKAKASNGGARKIRLGETMVVEVTANGIGPCLVCGKLYQVMPPRCRFCYPHKRVVDAVKKSFMPKKGQEHNPFEKELQMLEEVIAEKAPPPSRLSRMVYDHLEKNPADELNRRKRYDIASFYEKFCVSTKVRCGFKMRFMWRGQFIKFIMKRDEVDEEEGIRRWNNRSASATEEEKRHDGPEKAPLRLATTVEDFLIGETETANIKALQLQSKPQKIKDEQQIAEGQDWIKRNHLGLDDALFADKLGGAVKQLSESQILGNNASGMGVSTSAAQNSNFAGPDDKKKGKTFTLDKEVAALRSLFDRTLSKLKTAIRECLSKASQAEEIARVAGDEVLGLAHYNTMLERRKQYLSLLQMDSQNSASCSSFEVIPEEDLDGAVSFSVCVKTAYDARATDSWAEPFQKGLKEINKVPGKVILILQQCGWHKEKGEFQPALPVKRLEWLHSGAQILKISYLAEAYLAQLITQHVADRIPMPLQNMEHLSSIAGLQFEEFIVDAIVDEDTFKKRKSFVELQFKSFQAIVAKVKSAADDITALVTKHQKTEDNKEQAAADKQSKKLEKEAQTLKRKNEAAAKADARKKAKSGASAAAMILAKPAVVAMPAVCLAASGVRTLERFGSRAAGSVAGKPYKIEKHEVLKSLMEEKAIAASLGIYRIQCKTQQTMKDFGRHQMPLQADRKQRISELLLQCGPDDRIEMPREHCMGASLLQVSVWAAAPTMASCAIERNGIGNIRYQVSGSRLVVVASFAALEKIGMATKVEWQEDDLVSYGKRVLQNVSQECVAECDGIWKTTIGPGEVLVVPPGHFIAEKTVPVKAGELSVEEERNSYVFGLRVHHLDKSGASVLEHMVKCQESKAKKGKSDETAIFWNTNCHLCK